MDLSNSRRQGFTLVEVMVATFLLVVVFAGLTAIYTRGRTQMDYEEDRRKATAVLQDRFDTIRPQYRFTTLETLNGSPPVLYMVDNKRFTVGHLVVVGEPETQAATITLTVAWDARLESGISAARTMTCTTILGRAL